MHQARPKCGGSLSSTATRPSSDRDPYLCEGLTEVHLCRAAQGFEASQAVSLGHSVLMLHGLASAAECEALRTDAVAGAAVERVHASRESRIRMQLETLREPSVALYDLLLLRACERPCLQLLARDGPLRSRPRPLGSPWRASGSLSRARGNRGGAIGQFLARKREGRPSALS